MPPSADNLASIAKYRRHAAGYDAHAHRTWPIRLECIERLVLAPGDTVLDAGCGTGLSFEPIAERIAPHGFLLAFEQSPEMHAIAARRADALRARGLRVELQCARAEDVRLPGRPGAVLFHYVHDLLRTPAALDNLFGQFDPGTRVAIAGMKYFPWWLAPLNLYAWLKNRPYNVHGHRLHAPWRPAAARLDGFAWRPTQWGMGYVASGRVSAAARPR